MATLFGSLYRGWTWRPFSSGFPVSLPSRSVTCFCSSMDRSSRGAREKTTPRSQIVIARSRSWFLAFVICREHVLDPGAGILAPSDWTYIETFEMVDRRPFGQRRTPRILRSHRLHRVLCLGKAWKTVLGRLASATLRTMDQYKATRASVSPSRGLEAPR